ncbi:TPA: hypothetical protein JBD08_05555 [Legionella pneumophila subsp. pneumophila]|uniref:recombinase family protein n=1 Tax=Legionella pneumophila TaxID=446 RepID=UPI000984D33D|nr:recombinase family protein [Legionella pneumophila]HAT9119664.1 hypothetical protein [Legionella pneumophila subsp. pneumophila]HAT1880831.1 recombinase family protein [Legionella pneumophila]HAT5920419.1 recombinase family protein [Legionella pneumophila]HAT5924032.1 recombinase family protein [Legionella pneumophila]
MLFFNQSRSFICTRNQEESIDEIFSEKVSGAKNERKELNRLLEKLRVGDIVCVIRLDRLGRRMIKLAEMILDFK